MYVYMHTSVCVCVW